MATLASDPMSNIYIKNLRNVDSDILMATMSAYGSITVSFPFNRLAASLFFGFFYFPPVFQPHLTPSSSFATFQNLYKKRSSNFAFVTFSNAASAQAAVAASPIDVEGNSCPVEMRTSEPFDPSKEREPRPAAEPTTNIYINQLETSDEDTLRATLQNFGTVEDVFVSSTRNYAFATFASVEEAQACVDSSPLNVGNDTCLVEMRRNVRRTKKSGGKSSKKKNRKRAPLEQQLYIQGLQPNATDDEIISGLSMYGEIKNVYRRKLRGSEDPDAYAEYAFVTFAEELSVNAAVADGSVMIGGSAIVCEPRRPRETSPIGE